MIITYHGEGCFKVQSGPISVVIDPLNDRMKPDVVLKTSAPLRGETPDSNVITGPGEYEIAEIEIHGSQLLQESTADKIMTAYAVKLEEIKLGFLGEAKMMPNSEVLEVLGDVDILFIPIGGKPYLEPDQAAKIVKQLEPKIVIPSHYKNPKEFLEEMGQKSEPMEKLTIKKKDIIELGESLKIVCLSQ